MNTKARTWRVVLGGAAAGTAAVIGFAGASASAEPVIPAPPAPAPVTVTQTVTVTPAATPAAEAPATAAAPAAASTAPAAATPAAATPAAATPAPTTPTEPPIQPAASGTITEFFKDKGVALEPQKAAGFTALNIVLPMPTGWSVVPDPNVPDAFGVIADRKGGDGLHTSNAQLLVYKLVGDFDPQIEERPRAVADRPHEVEARLPELRVAHLGEGEDDEILGENINRVLGTAEA